MKNIFECVMISALIILAACQPAVPVVVPQNTPVAPLSAVALPPPTAVPTAAPPTRPTIEEIKPVNILAFCTIIGKDPKTIVKAGTPINIVWGWSAKTEAQINDFIENSITEITLDGEIIQGKKLEGILKNQTSGDPEVVWFAEVGVLSPGSHKVTYDVKFKKMVDDGTTTYGPGGKTESSPDQCEIFVEVDSGSRGAP